MTFILNSACNLPNEQQYVHHILESLVALETLARVGPVRYFRGIWHSTGCPPCHSECSPLAAFSNLCSQPVLQTRYYIHPESPAKFLKVIDALETGCGRFRWPAGEACAHDEAIRCSQPGLHLQTSSIVRILKTTSLKFRSSPSRRGYVTGRTRGPLIRTE